MVQSLLDQIKVLYDEKCRQIESYQDEYSTLETKHNKLESDYKDLNDKFNQLQSKWNEFLGNISKELVENAVSTK